MAEASRAIKRSWDTHPDVLRDVLCTTLMQWKLMVSALLVKSVDIILPFKVRIPSEDGKRDFFRLGPNVVVNG
jgi:hypothetical protein